MVTAAETALTTPGSAQAHFDRGNSLLDRGEPAAAEASYRRALALAPAHAAVLGNLATALKRQGKLEDAVRAYRQAVALKPDDHDAHFNLGNALRDQGKPAEAEASYRAALALDPNRATTHNNLANVLKDQERLDEAVAFYRRAVALDPGYHFAYFNLALALHAQGDSVEAAAACRQAIAIKADYAVAVAKLGDILKFQGRAGEAAAYYRRARELAPDDPVFHSRLLQCLQYDPAMTPGALLLEHRAYGAALPAFKPPRHDNPRDPEKRLKIGYVSSDLHQHPVGFLMMPVLAEHDRAQFSIHCYSGRAGEDAATAFLKSRADIWRVTTGLSDEALAAMIRADGIDILVDLAGHTGGGRLPLFARKPAPVQVTWAGYEGTTGVDAIDYLITDRWVSPPGSERYAVEKLVRLPDCYLCWAVPDPAPPVGSLPAAEPGAVTFSSFNNFVKINPQVIALWGRLLRELPAAKLVMKDRELGDAAIRDRVRALFAAEGVAPGRIVIETRSLLAEYFQRYRGIDIALDPFPFAGGLTTIDALWMGVPVVTMPGERFASRHSLTYLTNAGLGELVADGPDSYIRIAKELAHDLPRLAALRAGMRARLRRSPLLQAKRFTRGLEEAFRAMWRAWCRQSDAR